MKTRVIYDGYLFYPQYYSRIFGWEYFMQEPSRTCFLKKEDAIRFCKSHSGLKDVVWSSDEN